MAKLYKTNGDIIHISPKGDKFSCEELQELVGGYFECVSLLDGNAFAFCNENGKLENLDYNQNASIMLNLIGDIKGDYFVGDVLFASLREVD